MEHPAIPPLPQPPPPPRPSGIFTYAVVGVLGLGGFGFGYLLFGDFVVIAVAVGLIIGLVGAFHYFTWGRSMTEQAKKEAKAQETKRTADERS